MGLLFFVSLCWTVMLVLGDSTCVPGEYKNNGECCPKCGSGKVVRTHCTKTTSTVCIPCVGNTYMDHPNGETKCLRCRLCDRGSGLVTKTQCTYTSNTVCDCEDTSFCPFRSDNNECDMCQKHKKCKAGEIIKNNGTKEKDTVCEKCPKGTFRNETMSNCAEWTKCLKGTIKTQGNSTHDNTCKEVHRRGYVIPIVMSAFAVVAIATHVCIKLIKRRPKKWKKKDGDEAKEDGQGPIQETTQVLNASQGNEHPDLIQVR